MSRPSAWHSAAPRGVPLNSGLPVFDGCAPASNLAKSLFSAASAGRLPFALVTISGASIATRQSPSTYGASAARISSSVRTAETCTSRPESSSTASPVARFRPQARSTPMWNTQPSLPHHGLVTGRKRGKQAVRTGVVDMRAGRRPAEHQESP